MKNKRKLPHRLLLLIPVILVAFLLVVMIGQEKMLNDILQKQEEANEELLKLKNEENRIKRMIEYAKTDEYRLEYARESLGYVMPDDVKIELETD